jgi:Domain of unknown function (DUF4129)
MTRAGVLSVRWLEWLALALLLLAASTWSPWLPWPAWVAAAVIPWLARMLAGARPYAPFASVYAGLAVLVSPRSLVLNSIRDPMLALVIAFFATFALGYALGLAFDGVRSGSRWAWLAPLIVLAPNPNALGVLAVLALGALGELERQREYSNDRALLEPRALMALSVTAFVIMVFSLFLPKPVAWISLTETAVEQTAPKVDQAPSEPAPTPDAVTPRPRRPAQSPIGNIPGLDIVMGFFLMAYLVVLMIIIRQARVQKRQWFRREQLWDLMPLIASAIFVIALQLLYLQVPPGSVTQAVRDARRGAALEPSQNEALVPPEAALPTAPTRDSTIPLAMLAVLLALSAWAWWRFRSRALPQSSPLEPIQEASSEPSAFAANRIRMAYKRFLEQCERVDSPRVSSETPLEFAARFSNLHVNARANVERLTELYEAVRYGGLALVERAEEAEGISERINAQLQMEFS